MKITGSTKIVGIVGFPISHSISPQMHNAAFSKLGMNWEYVPFEVSPEDLKKAVDGMRAEGVLGFNVTIPHKEAIVPILDEVLKLPRIIGAVNTVRNESGKLIGYNTDAAGFLESLKTDAGVNPKGIDALLIGAGGAAKAVAVMLAESGARRVAITDVDQKKSGFLASYVGSHFEADLISVKAGSPEMKSALARADLVVNATPTGMHPKENASPLEDASDLNPNAVVFDLVYNPPETKLMKQAKERGARAVNGLGMLVRQGAAAWSIWTGREAPVEVMRRAAKEALGIS